MQAAFGSQLNQFDEALQLDSDDIQYWLNQAQIELVTELFNGINRERRGFEQSQERFDDLQNLLVNNTLVAHHYDFLLTEDFDADYITFPENKLFLINHKSEVFYNFPEIDWGIQEVGGMDKREPNNTYNQARRGNKVAHQDDIHTLLDDPFNTTNPKTPLVTIQDEKIVVYTDKTFIVNQINILYLKRPVDVNIKEGTDSELSEHLHKELIRKAVDMFLNNTRELKQRLQRETPVANQQQNEQNNE